MLRKSARRLALCLRPEAPRIHFRPLSLYFQVLCSDSGRAHAHLRLDHAGQERLDDMLCESRWWAPEVGMEGRMSGDVKARAACTKARSISRHGEEPLAPTRNRLAWGFSVSAHVAVMSLSLKGEGYR